MNVRIVALWTARALGIGMCLFLGLFALDALDSGKPLSGSLVDFAIHLVPSALVLAVVLASWRRPWIGGVIFLALAAGYAMMVSFRVDWVLPISLPLLIAGLLLLWSSSANGQLHGGAAL